MGGAWARRIGLWAVCVGLGGGVGLLSDGPSLSEPWPPSRLAPPNSGAASPSTPRISGLWRVLPLPGEPLSGEIMFYDRQFEGGAGCGRIFGGYERRDPWFSAHDLHLEGRCEAEADLLERLNRAARLTRRGSVIELSDESGRVLLRLSPF